MLISVMSINFNNSQVGPDVAREDLMNSFMQTSVSSEIGFKYVPNFCVIIDRFQVCTLFFCPQRKVSSMYLINVSSEIGFMFLINVSSEMGLSKYVSCK